MRTAKKANPETILSSRLETLLGLQPWAHFLNPKGKGKARERSHRLIVERLCLEIAAGHPKIVLWRQNTGGGTFSGDNKSRFVSFGLIGQGDYTGIMFDGINHFGRRVSIEMKSAKGRPSYNQNTFTMLAEAMGACRIVSKCPLEVIKELSFHIGQPANIPHGFDKLTSL